ncbi:MAG: Ig-like domain-containing protein [Nitrosomonadales bacterium]|nr:Ig-like domain-containing protein [Nitrosomonadales bacterium]
MNSNFSKFFIVFAFIFAWVLSGCGGGAGDVGKKADPVMPTDLIAPTVTSTSPAASDTAFAINGAVTATFSEAMTASTVSSATFTLNNGVTGSVAVTGTTATFTPSGNLANSTTYTATITTGVRDAAGNAMESPYAWSFTTGTAADTTAPTVTATSPANNATGVAVNAAVTATFSENMNASTLTTSNVTLKNGATSVPGTVAYNGTTATFTPSSALAYSTPYTATVTTGVRDAAGNAMASNRVWTFTTGTAPDSTPPTITATNPANNATGVAVNTAVSATFSENMNASTVTTATFSLNNGVTGTVAYSGTTATLTPSSALAYSTQYTATVTTGVRDAAGNAMANNRVWRFTTRAAPPAGTVRILLLHHSTGFYIWEGDGIQTIPGGLDTYNTAHGTNYVIDELWYPSNTYPLGSNNPYDYWNLWVNTTDTSGQFDLEALTQNYDVIVFKHCFPVSDIEPDSGTPDVSSGGQTLENYYLQYAALKTRMLQFPDKKFIVWTGAALRAADTTVAKAARARIFFDWVKGTWDESGDNIYVWDFYELETGGTNYLLDENADSSDSHPGSAFAGRVAPYFVNRLVDIIEGRGDTGSLTGE